MSFNEILKNVSSNLYGVYNASPIHYLLDLLNQHDMYRFVPNRARAKCSLDITYRGVQDIDKLKKIIEIIGNNRDTQYHNIPIQSIMFDFIIKDQVMVIKDIANFDILLEYLISLLHILEGRAEQEDWDIQSIFTEDNPDLVYNSKGSLSEVMQALTSGELPTLFGFKFEFGLNCPSNLAKLINDDMTSVPNHDLEYDVDDFERYDYARYGEPALDLDSAAYYVQKVEENERKKQDLWEYDIETRLGRGLTNYCALPNYDKDVYNRGSFILKKYHYLKRDNFIELYK